MILGIIMYQGQRREFGIIVKMETEKYDLAGLEWYSNTTTVTPRQLNHVIIQVH